jgi:transcriptional regulator with XRE-family HTH domain
MDDRSQRLRHARTGKGFDTAAAAAEAFGWNRNTYASNENGNAPFSYRKAKEYAQAFGVRPEWLYDASGPVRAAADGGLAPIIGRVGANPDGEIVMTSADAAFDFAPLPPGGTSDSVALEVHGHSMRGYADDGALIYFEIQRTPPSQDMLGHVVVVETEDGRVLLKRLLRGSAPGLYDLESGNGATIRDVRLAWAAEPTAIIPPKHARKIILRGGDEAA